MDDDILTAEELLQREQYLEREAAELLPYKTDSCSYKLGYLNQQVYACLTCTPPESGKSPAGMCFACSIECHGDHEIAELFVKRHFRCDCGVHGTSLATYPCQLDHDKSLIGGDNNSANSYNHNFFHRYCICDTVYNPNQEEGTMIQCIICQDWFHESCLPLPAPSGHTYADLICGPCVTKFSLRPLSALSVSVEPDSKLNSPTVICISKQMVDNGNEPIGASSWLYLPKSWRSFMCQCEQCTNLVKSNYRSLVCLYEEETIWTPELDPDADKPLYDVGIAMLDRVDRVRAIEGVQAMDQLSVSLKTYLRQFAEEGKVVTDADIREFFDKLQKSRRC